MAIEVLLPLYFPSDSHSSIGDIAGKGRLTWGFRLRGWLAGSVKGELLVKRLVRENH